MSRNLAVFDFDHTILDENSDTAIINLLDKNNIPPEIKSLHHSDGWTSFMQGVFTLLHERGVSDGEIRNFIVQLPAVPGMPELIQELKKRGDYDIIVISDSNSLFIKMWLEQHNLHNCILQVFTNPAKVLNGKFTISPFHKQEECKLSSKNLCKGRVLDDFVERQKKDQTEYDRIVYVGDGANDFCPILRLGSKDLICVRNNFKLFELVTKAEKGTTFDNTGNKHAIKGEVFVWENGTDILNHIQT